MNNRCLVQLLLGMLAAFSLCRATDISVRVLSAKDGHPLPEKLIHLTITDPAIKHAPENEIFSSRVYTDGDGVARFHVDVTVPGDALIDVLGLADYCSHRQYRADEIRITGAADRVLGACPHRPLKKLVVPPHANEIVMFSGEYTRWEKLLYFPWPS